MPRYFFHVKNGRFFKDEIGAELPGIAEVRAHAIQTAGAMVQALHVERWNGGEWRLQVTNEAGDTLLRLRFSAEGIEAIGGRLPASGQFSERHAPPMEARLLKAFRTIPDIEVCEAITVLVENVGLDAHSYPPLRLI